MTIEEKMSLIISGVLEDKYKVSIIRPTSFNVENGTGEIILNNQSVYDLDSHWRQAAINAIKVIVDNRVKKMMNEV